MIIDVIVADGDGVVAIPMAVAGQVLGKAIARGHNGTETRNRLASGVLGPDMYNMREPLRRAGLRHID